jgi:hypothetical protein
VLIALALEFTVQGGLFVVSHLLYVVVGLFHDTGDVHGQDEVDVGCGACHFSNFFKDNMVGVLVFG